jgi:hypothetical protein
MARDVDHVTFLAALADSHQEKLAEALTKLENRVANLVADAPLKQGALYDLEWAVNAKRDIRTIVQQEYLVEVDRLIREYDLAVESNAEMLNFYGNFGRIDPEVVKQLKTMSFQGFNNIGNEYLEVISKQLYEATLVGTSFAESVAIVRASVGGRLARYSNQMVHDSVMQFNRGINVKLAKEAGIEKWKYVGSLVETSREFCKKHKDKVYTTEEVYAIWDDDWAGKMDGDPFIVAGGYNCGHQLIPYLEG